MSERRELVAREVFALDADWRREYWSQFRREYPVQAGVYYDTADRILAIVRTPRDEGQAWRAFLDALDEFEAAAASLWADPAGPNAEDMERLSQSRERVIECALVLAARCSDAQGDEADALELIRWAEAHHAALEPVAGNIMPPGTYACYVGGDDDPYMGPGILGAIRAAHPTERREGDGA